MEGKRVTALLRSAVGKQASDKIELAVPANEQERDADRNLRSCLLCAALGVSILDIANRAAGLAHVVENALIAFGSDADRPFD